MSFNLSEKKRTMSEPDNDFSVDDFDAALTWRPPVQEAQLLSHPKPEPHQEIQSEEFPSEPVEASVVTRNETSYANLGNRFILLNSVKNPPQTYLRDKQHDVAIPE